MKNEFIYREQISSFIFGDIRGAKTLMDTSIKNENGINGFIQDIEYTPFGFQLYSAIQVYLNVLYQRQKFNNIF